MPVRNSMLHAACMFLPIQAKNASSLCKLRVRFPHLSRHSRSMKRRGAGREAEEYRGIHFRARLGWWKGVKHTKDTKGYTFLSVCSIWY